jgi:hypothetical protein
LPSLAHAFDAQALWLSPANGGVAAPGQMNALQPGGGGIFGTGGAHDYGITCANCHVNNKQQQGKIDMSVAFTPALGGVAGAATYQPGQKYTVTATMTGEWLGQSGCSPYVTGNINNFAASFEDSGGKPTGTLTSDSGQTGTSCPSSAPQVSSGTTMLYGDCKVIFSMGGDKADSGRTSWTFSWTAPAAGSGPLTMFWGAVDGDCMMDSLGDDVKVGTLKMTEATAARAWLPIRWAVLALVPLALSATTLRPTRRGARGSRRRRLAREPDQARA